MNEIRSIVLLTFLIFGNPTVATSEDLPEMPASWQTVSFSTELPAPFHSVSVTLRSDDSAAKKVAIEVNGKSLEIDEELLNGLSDLRNAEIGYSDPAASESGLVEYFNVVILHGEYHLVRHKQCDDDQNNEFDYDIVVFRIDRSLMITQELWPAEIVNDCQE